MTINKLTSDEYGSLLEREFVLDDGMNIFEGNNESGKSTILSFIRFMLYGMPRKSPTTVTERDRGISWNGGVAGGSMEVSVPDRNGEVRQYRIERHGQLRGSTGHENYTEALKIIDLATGDEVFEGEEPGRVLLGISQETYVSTACIRQLECSDIDGVGVNASIENLLFAANEGINTEKAKGKLDDIRRTLLHKNGKGGRLVELEARRAVLEDKLERAKEAAETIVAKEGAVEATAILENEIGARIRECEGAISLYENCAILKRFDDLHERERKLEELEKQMDTLRLEKGYPGQLPTREEIAAIEAEGRSLSGASTAVTAAVAELSKAKNAKDGDRQLAELSDAVEQAGGRESLLSEFAHLSGRHKKARVGGLIALVGGALLLVVAAIALLCTLVPGLSFLAPLVALLEEGILPATLFNAVCYAIVGVGAAVIALGVYRMTSAAKALQRRSALASGVGYSAADMTYDGFAAHMDRCAEENAACQSYDEGVRAASAHLERCRKALADKLEDIHQRLCAYNADLEDNEPDTVGERIRTTVELLLDLCRDKEKLEGDIATCRAMIRSSREGLGGYSEDTLRSAIGKHDPAKVLAGTDISKIEMSHRYCKEQLAAATSKRISLEKELIALNASSENPAKLYAKLDEVCVELEELDFRYKAVVMASEAIDTASDNLRRSVTPRIREKAGALMSRITDGKYCELGVTADMTVNIFAGNSTRSIDVLSKGTRDAAYLALRMALADLVCPGNHPALTMDEGLSLLDEERAARVLAMLAEYTQGGGQCLLFTCHKREGQLMNEIGPFKHIILS